MTAEGFEMAPATGLAVREELAPVPNPQTGELIDPADLEGVGVAIMALREKRAEIDGYIRQATEIMVEQSKVVGTKTLRFGAVEVVVKTSDDVIVQDWAALRAALHAAGLPDDRIDALTKPKTVYSLDARVEKQLRSTNEVYAQILDAYVTRIPKNPSASVKA